MGDDRAKADITEMLRAFGRDGHREALARVLPLVYGELRSLSEAYLRRERADHTLQATALVHEAYLRLANAESIEWRDRAHFFRTAALVMRRILVNHAKAHRAAKRGGGQAPITLEEATVCLPDLQVDLLDLDAALNRLADHDGSKSQVVELRFFGGCTIDETAEALGISSATAERHWRFARAWLCRELAPPEG